MNSSQSLPYPTGASTPGSAERRWSRGLFFLLPLFFLTFMAILPSGQVDAVRTECSGSDNWGSATLEAVETSESSSEARTNAVCEIRKTLEANSQYGRRPAARLPDDIFRNLSVFLDSDGEEQQWPFRSDSVSLHFHQVLRAALPVRAGPSA